MNCEEARQKIAIKDVLETFNLFPVKENRRTAFYFALDREEKVPSFSVDFIKNKAFDFGTGKGYDVISIVQLVKKCSVSDALKYLENIDFSVNTEVQNLEPNMKKVYEILKVSKIQNFALIQYLISRGVYQQKDLIKEIHYKMNGKKYFGVGFFNDSGGIEIRNKYSKICLGKKDVTFVSTQPKKSKEIAIFEGFFDYLTFKMLEKQQSSDYLILNSTSMLLKVKNLLNDYDKILLFMDNDNSGKSVKNKILNLYNNVEDCSVIYSDFNDFNDWHCNYNRET